MEEFACNVCQSRLIGDVVLRGDGHRVLFCGKCGMGVIENPPASTDAFYCDGYYGGGSGEGVGYEDYDFTAEHTQLWVRLLISALREQGGRILDIGCANGALLASLPTGFELHGIEVNGAAAETARGHGVNILGTDINDKGVASGQHGHFDLITSIATFEHVLDLRGAFDACLDMLSPGGCLVFEVPLISKTADNADWFNGSYEHIYYPTESGIRCLMDGTGVFWRGAEAPIRGFSSTYIGVVAKDPATFRHVSDLFQAMTQDHLGGLGLRERRINLAYHVIHSFSATPERVLALPDLLEVASTPYLLRRLMQLWHADSVRAAAADYHEQQAASWQEAWQSASEGHTQARNALAEAAAAAEYHKQQATSWQEAWQSASEGHTQARDALAEAAEYHKQQAANWQEAWRLANEACTQDLGHAREPSGLVGPVRD